MRGFQYIPSSVGLECLLFPVKWFTRVIRENQFRAEAIGQVEIEHMGGRILWTLDATGQRNSISNSLLDHLAIEAGFRGLFYLFATVSREDPAFTVLRNAGYASSGWQNIWKYRTNDQTKKPSELSWQRYSSADLLSVCLLQNKLLTHQEKLITPPINKKSPGYVLVHDESICGYAYTLSSTDKALITPVIDTSKAPGCAAMSSLLVNHIHNVKTVFLVQSSSQDWIENELNEYIQPVKPRQEMLVKYLAVRDKILATNFNHAANNRHTDTVTPIVKSNGFKDNI